MTGRVRAYVPATLALLGEWHAAGAVPADADRLLAPDEDEESEYAALMGAADASRELLGGPGRRVVLAADVTRGQGPVPRSDWAAVHVDTRDDADPDDDLAWYAVQEIAGLSADL